MLGLVVGAMFGFYLCMTAYTTTTDEQIEYVEGIMLSLNQEYGRETYYLNKDMKVGLFIDRYFQYKTISRSFLSSELEKICGYRGDYVPPLMSDFNAELNGFCSDICSD